MPHPAPPGAALPPPPAVFAALPAPRLPFPASASGLLPLQGLTILAVEDSRFACEALRLICQRAGARLRRAETLEAARAHLAVYRPDAVLVDIGLPDGDGTRLIRSLAGAVPRIPVILGISGDPAARAAVALAGADAFLEKPVEHLSDLIAAIRNRLPLAATAAVPGEDLPHPDPMALIDDLRRAETLLSAGLPQPWLSGFLAGIARQTRDPALADALPGLASPEGRARLRRLLGQRIAESPPAFAAAPPD